MLQQVHQVVQERFRKGNAVHILDWLVTLPTINQAEADMLEASFDKDEIRRSLLEAEGDKASKSK